MLGQLIAEAGRRASALAPATSRATKPMPAPDGRQRFARALSGPSVALIAELKRQSPSKGVLDGSLGVERCLAYERGGAAALSVLTEPSRFGGSIDDVVTVRRNVGIPVLRKDFIVDAAQVAEAHQAGADAVLLIARALDPSRAADLAACASEYGLGVLYEVRTEVELARAVAVPGCIIGVNARNLETLAVDPAVPERLIPLIPPDRVAVFESGITGRGDVERAAALGADAVLVGSALSTAADGELAARALTGVARRPRG